MSDAATIITGAQVALTIIKQLQKAVNAKHGALTLKDVQAVVQRNLDAELDWDASKAKRLAALEKAEEAKPEPKPSAQKPAPKPAKAKPEA